MFLFIVTIAVAVWVADPDIDAKDIYVRLGMPKMETCDYRIHICEDGAWTTHVTQTHHLKECQQAI